MSAARSTRRRVVGFRNYSFAFMELIRPRARHKIGADLKRDESVTAFNDSRRGGGSSLRGGSWADYWDR